jgi:hypothetical protein
MCGIGARIFSWLELVGKKIPFREFPLNVNSTSREKQDALAEGAISGQFHTFRPQTILMMLTYDFKQTE